MHWACNTMTCSKAVSRHAPAFGRRVTDGRMAAGTSIDVNQIVCPPQRKYPGCNLWLAKISSSQDLYALCFGTVLATKGSLMSSRR